MTPTDPALLAHASRLLVGTGIDPADVDAVASGTHPAAGTAADALRDGWRTAAAHTEPHRCLDRPR